MIKKIINEKLTAGIYCYISVSNWKIVYIGKDSRLRDNNRHICHMNKHKKRQQLIDEKIQSSPKSYLYMQLLFCDKDNLDVLESILINALKPKYNVLGKK